MPSLSGLAVRVVEDAGATDRLEHLGAAGRRCAAPPRSTKGEHHASVARSDPAVHAKGERSCADSAPQWVRAGTARIAFA